MNQIQQRFIDCGNIRLRLSESGVGHSERILFLHGFPERKECWQPYLSSLGRQYHCIAPDNRGFGESDRPTDVAEYKIANILQDILAIASQTGGTPLTVVGHDWGGIVAWHFASIYPNIVKQLVVLNAPHPEIFQQSIVRDKSQRAASQYINRFRSAECEQRLLALGIDNFWMTLFGQHLTSRSISQQQKEQQIMQWSKPGALTAMLNWYRASGIEVPSPDEEICDFDLSAHKSTMHVRVPTMVIWGMLDQLLLPLQLDNLALYVDDLRIERIQNAGHGLIHEVPNIIIELLHDFINRDKQVTAL